MSNTPEEHPCAAVPRSEQTDRLVAKLFAAHDDEPKRTAGELRGLCWEAARYIGIISRESAAELDELRKQLHAAQNLILELHAENGS